MEVRVVINRKNWQKRRKNRMEQYERILRQYPDYWEAIRRIDRIHRLKADERLYLMVIVPPLVEYVRWVLRHAEQNGKRRLYFLSRDGYQMYLIAQEMVEQGNLPIECRYLQVSRYSMRVPGYHLDLEQGLSSIFFGGINVTVEKILRRGALTNEEIQNVIREIGWERMTGRMLNYPQIRRLYKHIQKSKQIRNYMRSHSLQAYDDAIGYLKQEGLCDPIPYALVDSGWIGTLQNSIEALVKSVSEDISLEGYYFGMYEQPRQRKRNQFHPYYFSDRKGIRRKTNFSNSLFETIVSSPEGMVIGYIRESEGYMAVKKENSNPNHKQIKRNIKVLRMFLKEYHPVTISDRTKLAQKLLTPFMAKPTALELACYGDNYFSDDLLDHDHQRVAADLTLAQIREQRLWNKLLIIMGIEKQSIHESAWLEGSAVRAVSRISIPPGRKKRRIREELKHIRWYKTVVYLRKQFGV